MKKILTDKEISKKLFKDSLYKNKSSFWVADKENVPVQNQNGFLIPVKKAPLSIYRAMPASKVKVFLKKDIKKSKGIYFTSDLGDALTWASIFAEDDEEGSVVLSYKGKMNTKNFGEPDQLDHPNHVAYTGELKVSDFVIEYALTHEFAKNLM